MVESKMVKRRIPGIQVHQKILSSLKEELDHIHTEIARYKTLVSDESARQRGAFPQDLFSEKELIIAEIKELNHQKFELMQNRDCLNADLEGCRPLKSGLSLSQLEESKHKIEQRMINGKYTAREEKDFQLQLESIHKKKMELGDVVGKEKKANMIEANISSINAKLNGIFSELKSRRSELDELKGAIEGFKEKSKIKSPMIVEYEKEIEKLLKKKEDLIVLRKKELEEIRKKEEEHDEYLKVVGEQIESEKKREKQKGIISAIEDELSALNDEKMNHESDKYNGIIQAIRKCKPNHYDISLVSRLLQEGITILPESMEKKEEIIELLEKKKITAGQSKAGNLKSINERIRAIEERLASEKEILDSMPVSDVKIDRRIK